MRDGWKRVKLGDVCSLVTKGATPRSWGKQSDGIVFVKAENIVDGFLRCEHTNYISRDVHENELKRSRLQRGDLLITIAGAIGRTAIVSDEVLPANINQAVATVRVASQDVDVKYVYYYLRQPAVTQWLSALSAGQSVQANLNLKQVSEISLPLPPLPTQRKIAAVLGALDDKIELNRKMNANLEAQAQALFKSWFVDFEPWGGKMPKGWKKGNLGDVAKLNREVFNPSRNAGTMVLHFSLPAFDEGRIPTFQDAVEIKSNKTLLSESSILVSKLNPTIKRVWYPHVENRISVGSTEFLVFEPVNTHCRPWLFSVLNSDAYSTYLVEHATGSTNSHQRVSAGDAIAYELYIPSQDAIALYSDKVGQMYQLVQKNINESRKLAELRDALLPKLMSGELEVA